MEFIVIIACLAIERFLQFSGIKYQSTLVKPYYNFLCAKLPVINKVNPWVAACIVIVPVLIVTVLLGAFINHIVTIIGYFIFSFALFWYLTDYRDLIKRPYESMSAELILSNRYVKSFAVLFWYALLGPWGLILYVMTSELVDAVEQEAPKQHACFQLILAVLDWLPTRLLGLAFALIGNFGAVFPLWIKSLFSSLSGSRDRLLEWLCGALKIEHTQGQPLSLDVNQVDELVSLLDRALVVWLVVLAIILVAGIVS